MAGRSQGGAGNGASFPSRLDATLKLEQPVSSVKLVSPSRAAALRKLGVSTVRDLIRHFPRRYLDLSRIETVAASTIGETCTIRGSVYEVKVKRPRPRLALAEVTVVDETGALLVTAFRQPWLKDQLEPGCLVAVSGKVEFSYGFKRMTNPFIEKIEGAADARGIIVAVHPATEALSTAWIRRLVSNALDETAGVLDPLPLEIRCSRSLMSRQAAYRSIHFPRSMDEQAEARRRLAYEELLFLQIHLMQRAPSADREREAFRFGAEGKRLRSLLEHLPFELTDEQETARRQIIEACSGGVAAQHLLLGDVGTGKTVVAACAVASAADASCQSAFLAPTEILARQHARSLGPLFDESGVIWEVLCGSTPADERASILERLRAGVIDVLIGTHALLEEDVEFSSLGLAVVDEQQRFGVAQRASLVAKGKAVHALFLTATPIPRSLALALYGNMTLSYLRARPSGSAERSTTVVTYHERARAFDAAREALGRGERVYVVCPLIGEKAPSKEEKGASSKDRDEGDYPFESIAIESEDDLRERRSTVASAEREARFLADKVFAGFKVDLMHGRLSPDEKARVMERFRKGESQVLVSTTVVEVGVDVPEATVMIVEDADRFGLSQLHQLRGRVGRSGLASRVFLVSGTVNPEALARLSAMEGTDDGFELAAFDLSVRREGDILGNRQHGASTLKLVNVMRDSELIEEAHEDARRLLEADPILEGPDVRALAREVRLTFPNDTDLQGG